MRPRLLAVLFAGCVLGCKAPPAAPSAPAPPAPTPEGAAWLLAGSEDERFARVAGHLRGFDVAMVEVGYRYGELYWAGRDQNWDFARYQLGKIRTAVKNGVERRPKRGASAKMLEAPLAALEEAATRKDSALFSERLLSLNAICNACHQAERVPFVQVRPPQVRCSPTGPAESASVP